MIPIWNRFPNPSGPPSNYAEMCLHQYPTTLKKHEGDEEGTNERTHKLPNEQTSERAKKRGQPPEENKKQLEYYSRAPFLDPEPYVFRVQGHWAP